MVPSSEKRRLEASSSCISSRLGMFTLRVFSMNCSSSGSGFNKSIQNASVACSVESRSSSSVVSVRQSPPGLSNWIMGLTLYLGPSQGPEVSDRTLRHSSLRVAGFEGEDEHEAPCEHPQPATRVQ